MKAENKTLSAQVHDAILEMIIDSGSDSDNMLLTERELVERFGVSKAPVREALLRLCTEEVLSSIPRCGYVVVRLGEKSGRDNLIVRETLELSCLERYFDAFTPERIEVLSQKLLRVREECPPNASVWTIWQHNINFHCGLIEVSDNPYMVKHLANCIEVERRFYAQNYWRTSGRFETSFRPEAHEEILEAIRLRDKPLALARLRKDIANVWAPT